MKTLAVIPSRYQSQRFPAKPLASILGKPMISWVVEGLKTSKNISEIIVATDHDKIAQEAEKAGAIVVMTESDLPSGSDRVWQAVKDRDADWVLNIQGDEPLIQGDRLDSFISKCWQNKDWQMATLAQNIKEEDLDNKNVIKVLVNDNSEAIYFSRFPIPYSRNRKFSSDLAKKHIGIYAYKKDFLKKFCESPPCAMELNEGLEQLRALQMGTKIGVDYTSDDYWGVDTKEDVSVVEKILRLRK